MADQHAERVRDRQVCHVHTFVTVDVCGCCPDPTFPRTVAEWRHLGYDVVPAQIDGEA
jgi:hypothetical protein